MVWRLRNTKNSKVSWQNKKLRCCFILDSRPVSTLRIYNVCVNVEYAHPPCYVYSLLHQKGWPWFSYNLKVVKRLFWTLSRFRQSSLKWFSYNLKVVNAYACTHSSWGNKPWISSFVVSHDRDQAPCLCSFIYICSVNVRQCSLSYQRTSSYIVHTTKTFNLCVLQPPSTENIRCAQFLLDLLLAYLQ